MQIDCTCLVNIKYKFDGDTFNGLDAWRVQSQNFGKSWYFKMAVTSYTEELQKKVSSVLDSLQYDLPTCKIRTFYL